MVYMYNLGASLLHLYGILAVICMYRLMQVSFLYFFYFKDIYEIYLLHELLYSTAAIIRNAKIRNIILLLAFFQTLS